MFKTGQNESRLITTEKRLDNSEKRIRFWLGLCDIIPFQISPAVLAIQKNHEGTSCCFYITHHIFENKGFQCLWNIPLKAFLCDIQEFFAQRWEKDGINIGLERDERRGRCQELEMNECGSHTLSYLVNEGEGNLDFGARNHKRCPRLMLNPCQNERPISG